MCNSMQCNVVNIDSVHFLRKNVQICTAAVFTFARNTLDVTLAWNLILHFCQLNKLSPTMDNLCINIEKRIFPQSFTTFRRVPGRPASDKP